MTITLEQIEEKQSEITKMIAAFKHQPIFPLSVAIPPLNDGERYVGAIISADGTKRHHIILLPGEQKKIDWQFAMNWAASIGGELPDRCESTLLFATMKAEFDTEWYWTREQLASYSHSAWFQDFDTGTQHDRYKSAELRARAVRRLVIE